MAPLLALLALLLSCPAFGAESPGSAPQVVDAETSVEVEIQRRFNELRHEFLDNRREFLDKRAKDVDRWLVAVALLLAVIAIVATVAGILTFRRFREIETEARQNVARSQKHAEEAQRLVEVIAGHRDKAEAYKDRLEELTAEAASQKPDEAARTVASVQGDPAASPIDRAIAAAVRLQQQGNIEEAIEKWRSIANIVGPEEDLQLQARAWFSIGYLRSKGEKGDMTAAIDAYTRAIQLNPSNAVAYNNRGYAKTELDQSEAALADLDRAIELKPDYALAYNNRGYAKRNLGQYQAALADYDRAIELKSDYAAAYNNRGYAKTKLGQSEAALADLDRAIELKPDYAAAYDSRGNAKEKIGHINEARADYQQALNLAQKSGNEKSIAIVKCNLSRLDHNAAPRSQRQ